MKLLIILVLLLGIAFSSGSALPYPLKYKEGNRFFLFPDGNHELHLIDLEEKRVEPRFEAEQDTVLNLYTRQNPTNPNYLEYGNVNSLLASNFDISKPVKIIVHGWNSDADSKINTAVTAAFLNALDVNVIFVDWSVGGGGLYTSAVTNVPKVGNFLGAVIDWLEVNGAPIENFHIMGHSLGAHVVGIAARNVYSGKIPYISAFDPAYPLWGEGSERIRSSDGEYVEIIHTNAGELGLKDAVGHNDFYPNGGSNQPGCSIDVACSHSRSYLYFADSLDHTGFMADQCNSVDEATSNNCANIGRLHMGGSKPKAAMGIFHLKTNSQEPYYLG